MITRRGKDDDEWPSLIEGWTNDLVAYWKSQNQAVRIYNNFEYIKDILLQFMERFVFARDTISLALR